MWYFIHENTLACEGTSFSQKCLIFRCIPFSPEDWNELHKSTSLGGNVDSLCTTCIKPSVKIWSHREVIWVNEFSLWATVQLKKKEGATGKPTTSDRKHFKTIGWGRLLLLTDSWILLKHQDHACSVRWAGRVLFLPYDLPLLFNPHLSGAHAEIAALSGSLIVSHYDSITIRGSC